MVAGQQCVAGQRPVDPTERPEAGLVAETVRGRPGRLGRRHGFVAEQSGDGTAAGPSETAAAESGADAEHAKIPGRHALLLHLRRHSR